MKNIVFRRSFTAILLMTPTLLTAAGFNDTGITTCSNADSNGLGCPVNGFPGQDAEFGRDTAIGTAMKVGGGDAGFDFTKLDSNGRELPITATNHHCIRDNVTGLVWEIKTNDGGLRDQDWTYTWHPDANSVDGDAGRFNGNNCYRSGEHVGRCDTDWFVQDVNEDGLCGFNDWRMPTVKELVGIAHYGQYHPAIDSNYFRNTQNAEYWSGSPDVANSHNAWYVNFNTGFPEVDSWDDSYHVRLVRGTPIADTFIDNNNGTVTHLNTELMWAKCSEGQAVLDCVGDAMEMDWRTALTRANNAQLAGYTDWRLPNIKELQALIDYTRFDPAIDTGFFPNTPRVSRTNQWFWSSSPDAYYLNGAWVINAMNGSGKASGHVCDNLAYVRLVRTSIPLIITQNGTGSGHITSTNGQVNCTTTWCLFNMNSGDSVVLNAMPNENAQFTGWSGGGCSGIETCTVTMNIAQTVNAAFAINQTRSRSLVLSVSGAGAVNSDPSGINCPGDCNESYSDGATVTLTATPAANNTLMTWGGACSGNSDCHVTLNTSTNVTASFGEARHSSLDRNQLDWQVTELYIATLGYAPDNEGLQHWINNLRTVGWSITQVAQSFFDQPLVQSLYPADNGNDALIDALYQNLFGRAADAVGKTYWLDELNSGRLTRNQVVIALINGGWANADAAIDMQRFGNRIQVGLAFANEQAQRGLFYTALSTNEQAALRRIGAEILTGVTDDVTTRDAAIAALPGLLDAL